MEFIMKKILLVLIMACITGVSLFAWNPEDLTKFPSCMDGKSWLLNLGVGFYFPERFGNGLIYIPQIHTTLDRNIEMGDKKLPFFFGGLFGYSGYGYRNFWFRHNISIGGRFGYHLNWDVKNLDTYAVTTLGWVIYAGDKGYNYGPGIFLCGVNVGARYFLNNVFGFWGEVGFSSFFSILDVGLVFKF
jgi:hypothetical protein